MNKDKLTYRNEITYSTADSPRIHLNMQNLFDNSDICLYCVKIFFTHVKCPSNLRFGGEITKDENDIFECSIYKEPKIYAGKIIFKKIKIF